MRRRVRTAPTQVTLSLRRLAIGRNMLQPARDVASALSLLSVQKPRRCCSTRDNLASIRAQNLRTLYRSELLPRPRRGCCPVAPPIPPSSRETKRRSRRLRGWFIPTYRRSTGDGCRIKNCAIGCSKGPAVSPSCWKTNRRADPAARAAPGPADPAALIRSKRLRRSISRRPRCNLPR